MLLSIKPDNDAIERRIEQIAYTVKQLQIKANNRPSHVTLFADNSRGGEQDGGKRIMSAANGENEMKNLMQLFTVKYNNKINAAADTGVQRDDLMITNDAYELYKDSVENKGGNGAKDDSVLRANDQEDKSKIMSNNNFENSDAMANLNHDVEMHVIDQHNKDDKKVTEVEKSEVDEMVHSETGDKASVSADVEQLLLYTSQLLHEPRDNCTALILGDVTAVARAQSRHVGITPRVSRLNYHLNHRVTDCDKFKQDLGFIDHYLTGR